MHRSEKFIIGVLIVTWNRRDDLLECLASVKQSSYPRLGIYVVDNASTDGTYEAVAARHPDVNLMRSEENLGFAGGNNLGLSWVLEDEIDAAFLLNDDMIIAEEAVSSLVEKMGDPDVGALSPKVLVYSDPETIWAAGGMVDSRGATSQRHYGELDLGQADEPVEVDYAIGCSMLVKTEVVHRIGFMDSRYYMYYEESDWCRRMRRAGYRILYVPESQTWHKVSMNGHVRNSAPYYFARNRLLYLREGGTPPLTVAWIALSDMMRSAAVHALKGRSEESRLMVRAVADYYRKNFGRFRNDLAAEAPAKAE